MLIDIRVMLSDPALSAYSIPFLLSMANSKMERGQSNNHPPIRCGLTKGQDSGGRGLSEA
jgi:hypothetical protein